MGIHNTNMKRYLPSKKFTYLLISLLVVGIVLFIAFRLFQNNGYFDSSRDKGSLETKNMTINQLIQKDSDNDGVPDWEEALWGTDPQNSNTLGVSDRVYVDTKKKELNVQDVPDNDQKLTETEKFAREFFTAYVAMKASGDIDKDAINNFSSALGKAVSNPIIEDKYTTNDIIMSEESGTKANIKYYSDMRTLFNKYKSSGIGDELNIASIELTSANIKQTNKLIAIANAYEAFAKNALNISVPGGLTDLHLRIINDANNTGVSITSMTKLSSDPIIGLSGLSEYQKYSNDLISAVGDLESKLQ